MVFCVTPFTVVTWRITFPPECLGVLPYHPCGPQDPLSPPETVLPCLVAMVAHWPLMDAVSIMLAKEAKGVRDRSRLPGLSLFPLHHPGWHPTESSRRQQSCRPRVLAAGPCTVILGAIFPCRAGSQDPPHALWVEAGLPSNTDHSSSHPLPPKGT